LRPRYLRERLGLSLLFIGISGFAFVCIDARHDGLASEVKSIPLETGLDAHIPFVPAFIFAYLLYYPWLLLPVPILKRREDFYRALWAFFLMQALALAVFVAFPSRMARPDASTLPDGVVAELITWLYDMDRGWNVFPSLHVAHSALVAMLYWVHCRKAFAGVALGAALIAASTVLVKQHYFVDVPAGVLLAWACLRLARIRACAPSRAEPAPQRDAASSVSRRTRSGGAPA
jgi:membrane-associated phospholipid phosphatase